MGTNGLVKNSLKNIWKTQKIVVYLLQQKAKRLYLDMKVSG